MYKIISRSMVLAGVGGLVTSCSTITPPTQVELKQKRPNILWIYIEDMNPFMGCYGDDTIETPHMDGLAKNGVLFEKAFVTAGVCSPCRSAIITGRMQTTIGAHNHNSSYPKTPIPLPSYLQGNTLPQLFEANGYETFNQGKDHYNFQYNRKDMYTLQYAKGKKNEWATWRERKDKSKPFFAQFTLWGGKYALGGEKAFKNMKGRATEEKAMRSFPPYYPNDPVLRKHWRLHYDGVKMTDNFAGKIMANLKADGLLENTVVFCFSDHGCYMPRHKQWCYEGSLHVPLIISAPEGVKFSKDGTRRKDLVSALDVSATALNFAGIEIPKWYDSKDLFAPDYKRDYVVAAKDRMDFTIDRVRSMRTADGIKYIRNFMIDRPYRNPTYKDNRDYMIRCRELFGLGKLSTQQALFWSDYRPAEELYDLNVDPHEMNNLAQSPNYQKQLLEMRKKLNKWIKDTDDKGQYPEDTPNLKETYRRWGDKRCVNPEYDRFRPKN